jgi:hypothetical protein
MDYTHHTLDQWHALSRSAADWRVASISTEGGFAVVDAASVKRSGDHVTAGRWWGADLRSSGRKKEGHSFVLSRSRLEALILSTA